MRPLFEWVSEGEFRALCAVWCIMPHKYNPVDEYLWLCELFTGLHVHVLVG